MLFPVYISHVLIPFRSLQSDAWGPFRCPSRSDL